MTDEMLAAQALWLPNYAQEELAAAAERLAQHEANGTRVNLREGWQGSSRQPVKTIEEMTKDQAAARKNTAADKGEEFTKIS